jgi:putative CocE/NonD family hydrolase
MKRVSPLSALLVAAIITVASWAPSCTEAKETALVPMRDGVKLATEIYLPAGEGPWPTILVMTPYGRKGIEAMAGEAGKRGYALVSQDLRGRGDSEGTDYPVFSSCGWGERQDGYDTVEWIAKQKWSNGKVGMWASALASP